MQAIVAQDDRWLPREPLNNLIQQLRKINFSAKASRLIALQMINDLVSVHPYRITGNSTAPTGDIRFGTLNNAAGSAITASMIASLFVNTSRDGWEAAFTSVVGALQYSDRNNEKTMLTDGSGNEQTESVNAPDPEIVRSQYNDAFVQFGRGVGQMCQLLNARVGVHNFLSFEKQFGLIYSTTTQPPSDE
jgi:hypothetical protein